MPNIASKIQKLQHDTCFDSSSLLVEYAISTGFGIHRWLGSIRTAKRWPVALMNGNSKAVASLQRDMVVKHWHSIAEALLSL